MVQDLMLFKSLTHVDKLSFYEWHIVHKMSASRKDRNVNCKGKMLLMFRVTHILHFYVISADRSYFKVFNDRSNKLSK